MHDAWGGHRARRPSGHRPILALLSKQNRSVAAAGQCPCCVLRDSRDRHTRFSQQPRGGGDADARHRAVPQCCLAFDRLAGAHAPHDAAGYGAAMRRWHGGAGFRATPGCSAGGRDARATAPTDAAVALLADVRNPTTTDAMLRNLATLARTCEWARRYDVIVFHEGKATPCARAWRRSGTGRGSGSAPGIFLTCSRRTRRRPRTGRGRRLRTFGIGYRRMCRFWFSGVFELADVRNPIVFAAPGHGLGASLPVPSPRRFARTCCVEIKSHGRPTPSRNCIVENF